MNYETQVKGMCNYLQPVLHGDYVYLDPFKIADIRDEYIDWLNDAEVNQFLEVRFTRQTLGTVSEYVGSFQGSKEKYLWAIRAKSNDSMIGTATLGSINRYHRSGGIGMMIGSKEHRGKSVASEALDLLLGFAFCHLRLQRIVGQNIALNHKSNYLLRRAGFTCEGVAREAYWLGDEYVDGFHFGILAEEWKARQSPKAC